jgi:hypothetical protein
MKAAGNFPIGKSIKQNVALQRPSVDLKAAENAGEQAVALTRKSQPPAALSKFNKIGPPRSHAVMDMFGQD